MLLHDDHGGGPIRSATKLWRARPSAEVMGDLPGGGLGGHRGGALDVRRGGRPATREEQGHSVQWKIRVCGLGSEPKLVIPCRRNRDVYNDGLY